VCIHFDLHMNEKFPKASQEWDIMILLLVYKKKYIIYLYDDSA